jgi:glycosyltransferase involved in cell wall biosynthesis
MTTENQPIPLLLISDAPSSSTGLGRITRDLAIRIEKNMKDIYRVAVLGCGGPGSRKFGFQQYAIEGMQDWIIPALPEIWEDFAGKEKGICLTIWDPSRLMWFSQPARCEMLAEYPVLREWLTRSSFERWGYFPVDASGPNDKLSFPLQQTLLGFDRILAYGQWASEVIERTVGMDAARAKDLAWRPHGIDTSIFYERERTQCRFKFGQITGAQTLIKGPQLSSVLPNETLIGIVATNQSRKDWALGIETAAIIAKKRKLRLWIHTDSLERHWSIPSLLVDYGLLDKTIISQGVLSDDEMAQAYSACDLTLGIGQGEGFGFPLFESIACKTFCIHGNYGGASEWMPPEFLVEPVAYRYEGLYSCKRPVYKASDWAQKAEYVLKEIFRSNMHLNDQLDWNHLWPRWQDWLEKKAIV